MTSSENYAATFVSDGKLGTALLSLHLCTVMLSEQCSRASRTFRDNYSAAGLKNRKI